jgi:hypothetical protein
MKAFIREYRAPLIYLIVSLLFLSYANYEESSGNQVAFWSLSGAAALFLVNAVTATAHISRLARHAAVQAAALAEEADRVRGAHAEVAVLDFLSPRLSPRISEARALARNKLLESMNDTQRYTFQSMHYFDVVSDEGRHWRIHTTSIVGNVELMAPRNPWNEKNTYCIHLRVAACPPEDHWLAQALLLKISEKDFLRTAF